MYISMHICIYKYSEYMEMHVYSVLYNLLTNTNKEINSSLVIFEIYRFYIY